MPRRKGTADIASLLLKIGEVCVAAVDESGLLKVVKRAARKRKVKKAKPETKRDRSKKPSKPKPSRRRDEEDDEEQEEEGE